MYVCYVLESNRDNQSTTYLKAYERIRCVRSGRSKNLVVISLVKIITSTQKTLVKSALNRRENGKKSTAIDGLSIKKDI